MAGCISEAIRLAGTYTGDHRRPSAYQISGKRRQLFEMALCCVVLYGYVAAF
jgi:hypothetical protein